MGKAFFLCAKFFLVCATKVTLCATIVLFTGYGFETHSYENIKEHHYVWSLLGWHIIFHCIFAYTFDILNRKMGANSLCKYPALRYEMRNFTMFCCRILELKSKPTFVNVWVFLLWTKLNLFYHITWFNAITRFIKHIVRKGPCSKKIFELEFQILTTCQCNWLGKHLGVKTPFGIVHWRI